MSLASCKTCLATDLRMYDLRKSQLQELFEKLTCSNLTCEDGRTAICYICYSQLQRCHRFRSMADKANKLFHQSISTKSEIQQTVLTLGFTNNFIVTPIEAMSLPERMDATLVSVKVEPVEVKEEILEEVDIKVEAISQDEDDINIILPEENEINEISIDYTHYCDECNKTYLSQRSLRRHFRDKHDHTNLYKCKECPKSFSRMNLKSHMKSHNSVKVKTYSTKGVNSDSQIDYLQCNLCDKVLSHASSLKKHVASHLEEKPFVCDFCEKRFSHKTILKQHIRTHTGEKPFACQWCDKKFAQIGHYISHKRSHEGIKPYACEQCNKSFAERNTLKKHMRTHTGEKPYKCEMCDKSFSTRDTMKCHMRVHTGERPFACLKCGRTFSVRANYTRHLKYHE